MCDIYGQTCIIANLHKRICHMKTNVIYSNRICHTRVTYTFCDIYSPTGFTA